MSHRLISGALRKLAMIGTAGAVSFALRRRERGGVGGGHGHRRAGQRRVGQGFGGEGGSHLFCPGYGRGKGQAQMIPGWPYSVIAALEPGRTSWTAVLDAVRLGPNDDETEVTAAQVRDVVTRLIAAGHWGKGDPAILVVFDAGYDVTRLAWLLADLPVELLGRLRSDRGLQLPAPPRQPAPMGRPRNHGGQIALPEPPPGPARP